MLTNEDLQAISGLITSAVTASEERMMARMDKLDARMDKMDARMDRMEAQLEEIKEDTKITRGAVNALVEWAEQVGMLVNAPFPMLHNTAIEP